MTRSNWDQATDPRPETECPRCGETRLVEHVEDSHTAMFCNVCARAWRIEPPKKRGEDAFD